MGKAKRKIIGIIQPFDAYQTFYILDEGQKTHVTYMKVEEIPELLIQYCKLHKLNRVNLFGAEEYIKGIIKQIQKTELRKYNRNRLVLKYIKE